MTADRPGTGNGRPDDADLAELQDVSGELRRYAALADEPAPPGFANRVMAAVEASPAPAAGPVAWLHGMLASLAGPASRSLRMAALAAVVVIAVGGALVGAELSGLLRNGPPAGSSGSPGASPVVTTTPSATPSPSPSPEESSSPGATETGGEDPQTTPSAGAAEASQPGDSGATPRPSESEDSGGSSQPSSSPESSGTPEPGDH